MSTVPFGDTEWVFGTSTDFAGRVCQVSGVSRRSLIAAAINLVTPEFEMMDGGEGVINDFVEIVEGSLVRLNLYCDKEGVSIEDVLSKLQSTKTLTDISTLELKVGNDVGDVSDKISEFWPEYYGSSEDTLEYTFAVAALTLIGELQALTLFMTRYGRVRFARTPALKTLDGVIREIAFSADSIPLKDAIQDAYMRYVVRPRLYAYALERPSAITSDVMTARMGACAVLQQWLKMKGQRLTDAEVEAALKGFSISTMTIPELGTPSQDWHKRLSERKFYGEIQETWSFGVDPLDPIYGAGGANIAIAPVLVSADSQESTARSFIEFVLNRRLTFAAVKGYERRLAWDESFPNSVHVVPGPGDVKFAAYETASGPLVCDDTPIPIGLSEEEGYSIPGSPHWRNAKDAGIVRGSYVTMVDYDLAEALGAGYESWATDNGIAAFPDGSAVDVVKYVVRKCERTIMSSRLPAEIGIVSYGYDDEFGELRVQEKLQLESVSTKCHVAHYNPLIISERDRTPENPMRLIRGLAIDALLPLMTLLTR